MRQSTQSPASTAAIARALLAATAGLALLLATPARAGETLIWNQTGTDGSGAWDTTTANWSGTSGTSASFTNGDAVVFGIGADGVATGTGYHVVIADGGVTIGAQDYGSGTNPGMIIGSGSWTFSGGTLGGGSISITGTSALEFSSGTAGGRRYFYDQRIDIVDNADFTYLTSDNQTIALSGSTAVDVNGAAMNSGTNSNITLGVTGSFGGIFFYTNTTSGHGGALYAGGDLTAHSPVTGTYNWMNLVFQENNAGGRGGAIYSAGDLTFATPSGTDSLLTLYIVANNSGAEGGAIYVGGDVTLTGSTVIASNTAALHGGAIYSAGNVLVSAQTGSDSSIQNTAIIGANVSGSHGGAIHAGGDVTLEGVTSFVSNTAAGSGGAIYALGNVLISGTSTFSENYSGTNGLGGAIYTEGNLTVSGSGSVVSISRNRASGTATAISTVAHVGGILSLEEGTTLSTRGGGIAAQEYDIDGGTLVFLSGSSLTNGKLVLTVIDSSGNAVGATDKINFNNTTLSGDFGELAVNDGSQINITGTLTVVSQRAGINSSVISANLAGAGEIYKTGAGSTLLSGTNTHTGQATVAEGTLIGNIAASSTLTIHAGAVYKSGSNADRTLASLNGGGRIDMMDNVLTVHSGNFASGTIINTANLIKTTSDTLVIGSGTVVNISLNEGVLNIGADSQLTVTGTVSIADGLSLGVNINDADHHALKVNEFDFGAGAAIDIVGYGSITAYTESGTHALVISDNAIDHNAYTLNLGGLALNTAVTDKSQFLAFTDVSSGTQIAVETSLVWKNTANDSAHGTFIINTGTFSLNANLVDNTTASSWYADADGTWDGKSLTKDGEGTLILNGTNAYTGTTVIAAGLLVNSGTAVLGAVGNSAGVHVLDTGTLLNHGDISGAVVNEGVFTFESVLTLTTTDTTVVTGTTEDGAEITTGTTVVTGSYYSNGGINDVVNTGTFIVNTGTDYHWTGSLGGNAGVLIKTGASTFTLGGASSYSGDVEVRQGVLAAGKENLFNAFASSTIYSSGTLSLGGYNQSMTHIHNEGMLSMGPSITGSAADYIFTSATLKVGTLVTGSETTGRIFMRADYNSGIADRLEITGTASGTFAISFSNLNNATPDKTLQSIPLVVITGTDVEFELTGTTDVGMGRLMVYRGDGGSLSPDNDIWYLAATTRLSNVADAILSTASVAGLEWAYQIDTVRQRMGDLRQESLMAPPEKRQSPLAYTTVTSKGGNAWVRTNAYHLDADKKITTDAFEQDVYGVTFGYDKTYRWEDNQYLLGVYGQISHVKRDFDTRGDGKTNNIGVGFYFSYLKDNGWYGDTTLLLATNKNKFNAHPLDRMSETIHGDYRNSAWGLSQEVGKVIKHKKSGLWLEPSGQLSFSVINGKTYNTGATDYTESMEVKIADANVTQFRASLRTGWDIPRSRIKPHLRAAIVSVHTRGGRIRAGVEDPQYYTADMDGKRFEAGAGFSFIINERSQLYLDYEYAKADNYKRPWAINFGYRRTW